MPKEFKYKTSFAVNIVPAKDEGNKISLASLADLKSLIPDDVKGKMDLVPVVANLCVANLFNKNDDGVDKNSLLAAYKDFNHKQINLEHDRTYIIGHIVNVGFSKFSEDYLSSDVDSQLTEEEVRALGEFEPFNLAYAGVLYKVAAGGLIDVLAEYDDPKSTNYRGVSASWEVGFNDYDICVGDKYRKNCAVYSGQEAAGFEQYLKINGGPGCIEFEDASGTKQEKYVYRLIKGEIIPLGIGLTANPAAAVKGTYVLNEEDEENEESDASSKPDIAELVKRLEEIDKIAKAATDSINNLTQSISKNETPTVNKSIMKKFSSYSEFEAEAADEVTISPTELRALLNQKIQEVSSEYNKKVTEAQELARTSAEKEGELTTKIQNLETELNELKQKENDREAAAAFTARMTNLDDEYNISDAQRQIITKQITGLTEEAYSEWKKNFDVMFEALKKEAAAGTTTEENKTDEDNKGKEAAAALLNGAKPNQLPLPNGVQPVKRSEEAIAKLRESISISKK